VPDLLLSYYGDDFTGSTDALESLTLAGVPTVLFTAPPSDDQLARHPDLRALGVAGMTRSMQPAEMTQALAPAFAELNRLGAPIVHYKVCSTFDSSPTVGSLGPVIELGISTFGGRCIPIVVGAPALGRYCVFGNLFARSGAGSEPHRLDRHPSMSRHPVTPMNEADLRIHLAQQTRRSIGLVDITSVMSPADDALAVFKQAAGAFEIVFIDLLHEGNLAIVGRMLATGGAGRFVIGSSGVESALCAFWHEAGAIGPRAAIGRAAAAKGPILAVCGSCSPVTAAQIEWAARHGFVEVTLDPASPDAPAALAARLRLEKFMDRDLADGSAKAMYYKVVENREERDASLGMTFVARRTLNVSNVTTHPKDVLAGCEYRIEAQ